MAHPLINTFAEWIGKIMTGVFVLVIIIIGIKSEIVTPWQSPTTPVSYSVFGDDGRSMEVVLLPENIAIIWYDDDKNNYAEGNLVQWKGYLGTHYIWRIWNVSDNDTSFGLSLFGVRMYPDGVTPAVLDTEVLAHYISGSEKTVLPNKNDRIRQQTILFGANAIRFQDMWMEKDDVNNLQLEEDIDNMKALLIGEKSKKRL